jgi:hypothetical protein
MTPDQAKALREPFPDSVIGKLPRLTCKACGESREKHCDKHQLRKCAHCKAFISTAHIDLDYVGHAATTDRLLAVDSEWTWKPFTIEERQQVAAEQGELWIWLTIAGVTKPGVGDGKSAKERIGDAIRNGAMRFGVALDLWSKEDLAAREQAEPEPKPDTLLTSIGERLKTLLAGDVDAIKMFLQSYFGEAYTGRLSDLEDSELERLRKDLEEDGETALAYAQAELIQDTPARSIEDNPLPEPQEIQITDEQRDDLIRSADRKGLDLGLWLGEQGIEGPLSQVSSERASELLKLIHALPDPAQESLPVGDDGWVEDDPKAAAKERQKAKVK